MTIKILIGDVREQLRTLAADSVHCCVTSPPYWGLRDYGIDGQIGLEASPAEFIGVMVDVFEEVRRVLRPDGTCWINMGDSYATGAGKVNTAPGGGTQGERWTGVRGDDKAPARGPMTQPNRMPQPGLKPKDLCMMPHRLAIALQAAGWWVRQDIVWSKPNPMPESMRDRCTKSHEYIFLLTKSEKYYFDQDAICEPVSAGTHARLSQDVLRQVGSARANGGAKTNGMMNPVARGVGVRFGHGTDSTARQRGRVKSMAADVIDTSANARMGHGSGWRKLETDDSGIKNNASFDQAMAIMPATRNKRSVWTMVTQSFKEAHFATFPTELPETCIKAGCPPGGTVLDPFFGAGTTGLVADRLQRDCIGIELNPAYAEIARKRIQAESTLFAEISVAA
ncbi:DNA methylase [Janthinobacterium sp. 35]|uniref:DNA-methyltransferase n=1 Tax=Janthinobacterium sp. 35 TaxID=2035210 RepID=UPI000C19A621|nr:site-specific DNA-methyltransferase [Janthinobacterium sp. 35]PIG25463.1 DNA methylase [Janthinobacterium sp. 35]